MNAGMTKQITACRHSSYNVKHSREEVYLFFIHKDPLTNAF